jgi:hypothetical protein
MSSTLKHRLAIVLGFLVAALGAILVPALEHLKVDATTTTIILTVAFPAIVARVNKFIGQDADATALSSKAFHILCTAAGLAGPVLAWASPRVPWLGASAVTGGFIAMLVATWAKQPNALPDARLGDSQLDPTFVGRPPTTGGGAAAACVLWLLLGGAVLTALLWSPNANAQALVPKLHADLPGTLGCFDEKTREYCGRVVNVTGVGGLSLLRRTVTGGAFTGGLGIVVDFWAQRWSTISAGVAVAAEARGAGANYANVALLVGVFKIAWVGAMVHVDSTLTEWSLLAGVDPLALVAVVKGFGPVAVQPAS